MAKPVRIAVASSSQIAADAGADVAQAGGNAVDAAIAASLVQLVTEPGVVSLAAGGFVVVWPPDAQPIMVDGAMEMPGRNAPADRLGQGGRDVVLNYGGGAPTTIGYGSVATPGALAGIRACLGAVRQNAVEVAGGAGLSPCPRRISAAAGLATLHRYCA